LVTVLTGGGSLFGREAAEVPPLPRRAVPPEISHGPHRRENSSRSWPKTQFCWGNSEVSLGTPGKAQANIDGFGVNLVGFKSIFVLLRPGSSEEYFVVKILTSPDPSS